MKLQRSKIKLLYLFIIMSIIVCTITMFNPNIGGDEPFSMSLIHHSYVSMLNINSLDVHPPLYYIILKFFLSLTTFWTNSILLKIIFARILSLIFFFITFYELWLLLKLLRISGNILVQFLTYLSLVPTITYVFQIRMYELALMLLSIELYHLIKFIKFNKHKDLFIVVASATLASYTHYFAAIFAGVILIVFIFKELWNHHLKKCLALIYAGLSIVILFIPCFHLAFNQFIYTSSNKYNNNTGTIGANNIIIRLCSIISGLSFHNYIALFLGVVITLLTMYFTIYIIFHSCSDDKVLIDCLIVFLFSLIIPIVFSIIHNPILQGRYFYPITSIYDFVLINSIFNNYNHSTSLYKVIIVLMLILMPLSIFAKSFIQFKSDLQSFNNYKVSKGIYNNNKRKVHINGSKFNGNNIIQQYVYLDYNKAHKDIIVYNINYKNIFGSNNKHLAIRLLNNINIK